MYSSSSSISDSSSESSDDSYDRGRRRRPHRSRSRKTRHSMFDDEDAPRYSKESRKLSRKLSLPLMKHELQLSVEKPKSRRTKSRQKKHRSIELDAAVSREELKEIKRQYSKELAVSREELEEIKRQHLKELNRQKNHPSIELDAAVSREELKEIKRQYSKELAVSREELEEIKRQHSKELNRQKNHRSIELDAAVSREELKEIKRQHSKELKNLVKFLQKESSVLNGIEEEKREELYELKLSREKESTVTREEFNEMKRQHAKQLKSLLKFLEKESSLLNDIEEEKREVIYELKCQHEKEVKKIFEFQEKELADVIEQHAIKQAELEDKLERSRAEANEELRGCKEQALALEGDLRSKTEELQLSSQKATYEMDELKGELSTAVRENSFLEHEVQMLREQREDEVQMLREKLAERDSHIRQLEGVNSKSSYIEKELRDEIRCKEDEIRRKDRTIMMKNEEIRSLSSTRPTVTKQQVDSIHIDGCEWEETSGLTIPSGVDIQKEYYRMKPPMKSEFSPERGRNTSNSSSKRRDNRDDLETRKLSVSFSEETEKRALPMQAHDNLSKRLEKLYLHKQ